MANSFLKNAGSFSAFRSAAGEARDGHGTHGLHQDEGKPAIVPAFANSEATELERKVLAYERILQTLISHIAATQPEILAELKVIFGSGQSLGEYGQDSTDQHGDHFIRMIEDAIADYRGPGFVTGDRT